MNIKHINTEDILNMIGKEGLVIMGCGGDLSEWLDGINSIFEETEILRGGSRFKKAYSFEYKNLICLLFPFDDVKPDMEKLAMWRLNTHEVYGGVWLSDFIHGYVGELAAEVERQTN